MKKRDLNDIMREVKKEGVKEPETIRKYLCTLGNRSLYSLMYGDKARCSEEERYECWSCLEFVLTAYTYFRDFTDEEITYCMKHITLKDFLCLIDHLNDLNMDLAGFEERGVLRNDFGVEHMREMAMGYLLKLMLRAKGRGDTDVNNFCMINVNSIFGVADENDSQYASVQEEEGSDKEETAQKKAGAGEKKKKPEMFIDFFYHIKERVNLDDGSWMSLDIGDKEVLFGCARDLMIKCMEDFGFGERFSLPKVLERCEIMCTKNANVQLAKWFL